MLNSVCLMGRLTADPELKSTPSGVSVTTFTLAANRSYVKQGEERQADFINIVAWRATAEFVCRYFSKGQMMAVTGSIQTRTYTDKEGKNRKAFEVVAQGVDFCGDKQEKRTDDIDPDESEPPAQGFSSGSDDDFSVVTDDQDLPF